MSEDVTCLERDFQEMLKVAGQPDSPEQEKGLRNLFSMGYFAGCKAFATAKDEMARAMIALDLLKELQRLESGAAKPESETAH